MRDERASRLTLTRARSGRTGAVARVTREVSRLLVLDAALPRLDSRRGLHCLTGPHDRSSAAGSQLLWSTGPGPTNESVADDRRVPTVPDQFRASNAGGAGAYDGRRQAPGRGHRESVGRDLARALLLGRADVRRLGRTEEVAGLSPATSTPGTCRICTGSSRSAAVALAGVQEDLGAGPSSVAFCVSDPPRPDLERSLDLRAARKRERTGAPFRSAPGRNPAWPALGAGVQRTGRPSPRLGLTSADRSLQ
jgi:hypothetical protein